MSLAEKTLALLATTRPEDVRSLPPAQRRRFADLCRYLANAAEPPKAVPKSGVIAELTSGHRPQ